MLAVDVASDNSRWGTKIMISKIVSSQILGNVLSNVALLIFIVCWFGAFNVRPLFSIPYERARQTKRERYGPTKRTMPEVKLYPVDEASKDHSFKDFRQKLLRATRKRDSRFILTTVDPEIRLGLGGERGMKVFEEKWKPQKRNSPFWKQLNTILSLGGTFESSNGEKKYCAPYVTTRWKTLVKRFPEFANANEYAVVLGRSVKVRSKASRVAGVVQTLSFDVVKLAQLGSDARMDNEGLHWLRIRTSRGHVGYISARDLRSPIDYSACFKSVSGRWVMVSFIAGD
jgi:hypothetical protein